MPRIWRALSIVDQQFTKLKHAIFVMSMLIDISGLRTHKARVGKSEHNGNR
jgi:hypothetical protein